tara:strand:+ start:3077 stop:3838 length:762 start_codon:yes stop_codon:yes gene_type:complete
LRLLLAFLFFSALASTSAVAEDLNLAKQAEEKAFAAADQGLWCDATLHFLKAHQEAPAAQYIYNAAMAADSAGDRRWALHLFVLILGTYPDDERTKTISERTQIISQEIAKEGPGNPCATRVADNTPQTQKDAFWLETTPMPPAPPAPSAPTPMVFGDTNIRWTVVATGGTLALGGATMTVFGAYPYIEGLELYQRVLDDNSSQNRQAYTLVRERWQSLGRPVAIAGAAAFTLGGIVTAFGLKWALEKPEGSE